MADGELVDVAVLEVGHPLVPVVCPEAADVRAAGRADLSLRTSSSAWNANRISRTSSEVGRRWLTRKTETDRAPGGTIPSANPVAATGRTDSASFSPSLPGTSRSVGRWVLSGIIRETVTSRWRRFHEVGKWPEAASRGSPSASVMGLGSPSTSGPDSVAGPPGLAMPFAWNSGS